MHTCNIYAGVRKLQAPRGSSVWIFVHVALVAPRILNWLYNRCTPMYFIQYIAYNLYSDCKWRLYSVE